MLWQPLENNTFPCFPSPGTDIQVSHPKSFPLCVPLTGIMWRNPSSLGIWKPNAGHFSWDWRGHRKCSYYLVFFLLSLPVYTDIFQDETFGGRASGSTTVWTVPKAKPPASWLFTLACSSHRECLTTCQFFSSKCLLSTPVYKAMRKDSLGLKWATHPEGRKELHRHICKALWELREGVIFIRNGWWSYKLYWKDIYELHLHG